MALKDYAIRTHTISIDKKTDFTVRGISFEDVTRLVNKHGPVAAMAYAKFTAAKTEHDLRPEVVGLLLNEVLTQFPEALAEMIAIAADEPDSAGTVARLPVGVQLDAVEKIIDLTFTGESDIKKLVEIVTRMALRVQGGVESLTNSIPSGSGNGAFAVR